jgi:hypothetical protein
MKPNPNRSVKLLVLLALCHAPYAHAHSGPPFSVVVSLLWGGLAYLIAGVLLLISARKGKRLKYFLLLLLGYPVWWAISIFSVALLLERQPWDMIWAALLPCLLIAFAVHMRMKGAQVQPGFKAEN